MWRTQLSGASDPLRAVRVALLQRRIDRARAAAYRLGCETIDKARPKDTLLKSAAPVEAELMSLREPIAKLDDASARERLERARREALLDLEYVQNEKVMSSRLGQYQDSRPKP